MEALSELMVEPVLKVTTNGGVKTKTMISLVEEFEARRQGRLGRMGRWVSGDGLVPM